MQLDNVLYEVRGPMALITINRAEKHNAISLATLEDLHTAVDAAAWDDDVRVITITGAGGKAFAAGSDLSEVIHRDFKKALEPHLPDSVLYRDKKGFSVPLKGWLREELKEQVELLSKSEVLLYNTIASSVS